MRYFRSPARPYRRRGSVRIASVIRAGASS
nr:MAG TPA: hypothetical protein [Caudoviricetes sp.]